MLIAKTRLSFVVGSLFVGGGFWTVLKSNLFSLDILNPTQQFRIDHQDHDISATHTLLHSVSTQNGAFFSIEMGGEPVMNPNMIPHPFIEDAWILVAQLLDDTHYFAELVCTARFEGGILRCDDPPSKLPIASTFGDRCTGDLAFFSMNEGPHDARVFYGPRKPYTVFGSNSRYACFGQWVQDFQSLVEWGHDVDESSNDFALAVELQRPPPWNDIEKNWFLFWDLDGNMYVHHDIVPERVFAMVEDTGAVGSDMGAIARTTDAICMEKYMPAVGPHLESIHQATNSLSLTMCRRDDASCVPDISNTFIFTIFQHKKYYNFHAVYEPYIFIFEQVPPFKTHAISKKPFWISGRRPRTEDPSPSSKAYDPDHPQENVTPSMEQMLYITSISWKSRSQRYHGYIDDVLFIAFGIEDQETAAIDVVAGDLISDLGFC